MTNGEKMQAVFPNIEMWGESKDTLDYSLGGMIHRVTKSWWNAEYKEPTAKNDLGVDYISKEQAVKTIQRYGVGCFDADEFSPEECERFVIAKLNELPSVTLQPKKGHWIEERDDYGEIMAWHCSNCYDDSGFITDCKWDYCPSCGSDNREAVEE